MIVVEVAGLVVVVEAGAVVGVVGVDPLDDELVDAGVSVVPVALDVPAPLEVAAPLEVFVDGLVVGDDA